MSTLTVTIDGGKLSFDLYELFGNVTQKVRAELIDQLAIQSEVIDEVMNQVIEGCTTDGSHGSTSFGGNPDATHGIDGARMRIAKASSDIAAREIERLADELKRAKARIDEGWAAYRREIEERRRYS